jgi:hypothetical protein
LETSREKEKVVVAQDQAITTNSFKETVKEEIHSRCWLCKQHEETIDHLTSGCPILAKNEYLMRHSRVGAHLHDAEHKVSKQQK